MTFHAQRTWQRKIGEAALWAGACSVVLCTHLAAAAVLLRQDPEEVGAPEAPAAIMIEMAPEPEAAVTQETVISEQMQDQQEVRNEEPQPVEEVEPEPEPEPPVETAEAAPDDIQEPVTQTTQTIPDEELPPPDLPAEEQLAMLQHVEVPLPVIRPQPEAPKPEAPKEPAPKKVETRKPKPPASKAAVQAKVDVTESTRTAAAATSSSAGISSVSPARWQSKLAAHLGRQRGKCPASGKGSTAMVTFRIDASGNLSGVSLARSSGYSDFDQYMVDLVRRASPVPPPPAGLGNKVTVPLGYRNC
ncbi:TonB family protein [Rhizobium helianthi]|uniref:TonB family protein n=1 Tax=Rhizobium helianthi TaxID=1132695 RepID=A0ABW4LZR8_9HYPH